MASQTMQCRRSAFHPDDKPSDLEAMRTAYLAMRQDYGERALALCGEFSPDVMRRALGEGLIPVIESMTEGANELYLDPVFGTWANFTNRAVSRGAPNEIRFHCNKIDQVIARVKTRVSGEEPYYIPNTSIALQQNDIDPYVMAATPPSYDFVAMLSSGQGTNGHGHPLPMQQDLLGIAIDNIDKTWPELKAQIEDMVKIVGYLPDATFRSCSAARYAGVVYLGNMDERVLDVEESLVHEAGHQVLYRLGNLTPLVREGTPQTAGYTLPWSGSQRDLFGFLHAFYIYTLLTKYFWRRARLNAHELTDCMQRAVLILIGSRLALPTLLNDSNLTAQGRALVEVLATNLDSLQNEIEGTYGKAIDLHD
ncbi:HEXXH motif-containing putative peptide modification protein [Nocardia rhamnosiphila]|uniref:aKG-HExxH-type peptide beta-hydroxylase n=1 Tax=Nocardia rhamnosiphila TaxID=426716 RepID=UPI0033DE1306